MRRTEWWAHAVVGAHLGLLLGIAFALRTAARLSEDGAFLPGVQVIIAVAAPVIGWTAAGGAVLFLVARLGDRRVKR